MSTVMKCACCARASQDHGLPARRAERRDCACRAGGRTRIQPDRRAARLSGARDWQGWHRSKKGVNVDVWNERELRGFAEKYVASIRSTNLKDDERHHLTEALAAAALADRSGAGLGALLSRVKYADSAARRLFESGSANLAQLLRIWAASVSEKGRSHGWVKANTAWDQQAAQALYRRVAHASLAHWLDGKCVFCHGTGVTNNRQFCVPCKGGGRGEVQCAGRFERECIEDMVSELEGMVQAHNARASSRMRNIID